MKEKIVTNKQNTHENYQWINNVFDGKNCLQRNMHIILKIFQR